MREAAISSASRRDTTPGRHRLVKDQLTVDGRAGR
jgi:hypothetical protein